jgi:formylglycine-generating enzyme required for sulfatase activity
VQKDKAEARARAEVRLKAAETSAWLSGAGRDERGFARGTRRTPPAAPPSASGSGLALALASALACTWAATDAAAQEPYTQRLPGTVVSFEMIPVPAGTVATGRNAVEQEVGPFWIMKTETTWDVYDVYVYELDRAAAVDSGVDAVSRPTKPYVLPGDDFGHDGMPALGMSLHAARQFARWLSARTGHAYRVPTEAQWEHACRLGAAGEEAGDVAWTVEGSDYRTHAVATKSADALGLHDMRGNVAEWVEAAADSVVKGGAFDRPLADAACATRIPQSPGWQATDPQLPKSRWWLTDAPFVGLRLIRLPDDPTEQGGTP